MHSRKSIFIGSSSEALDFATILAEILKAEQWEATPWNLFFDAHGATSTTINTLKLAVESHRIGIFFLTPDDITTIRGGAVQPTARTNVWFEIGMFVAAYAPENVFVLVDRQDLGKIAEPSDYRGIQFVTYDMDVSLKNAVKKAYEKRATKPSFQLSPAVRDSIKKILTDAYAVKFKSHLLRVTNNPTTIVRYVQKREDCYKIGETLIRDAKERIYTVISYEEELNYGRPGLLPYIVERIERDRKNGDQSPKIRRWMNLGDKEIADQAREILHKFPEIEVRDTFCKFIEAVVTDSMTLLVLPKPDKITAMVGSGILIESSAITEQFALWFEIKLPEPLEVTLSSKNIEHYLALPLRNSGSRLNDRCFACATPLAKLGSLCSATAQQVADVNSKC